MKTSFLVLPLSLALAVVVAGCGPSSGPTASGSGPAPGGPPPAAGSTGNSNAAPAGTAAAAVPAGGDLGKVVGRWLRPDGGYILELRELDAATGRLNATYLNPQPIHVARAEAKLDGAKATVFVELQDVNYPGCTYRLTYFPASDQLYGVYYQAAMGQSFDVEFVRQK